jgi:hypothetical protein
MLPVITSAITRPGRIPRSTTTSGPQPETANSPAYQSDGYFWVRARIAVPPGLTGPLAIESQTDDPFSKVQELWVNGRLVGRYGDFPPRARPLAHPQLLVFDIPAGVA